MKHILLLGLIACISIAGSAQDNKYYRYGIKFVHNEYIRLNFSEKKIYYKGVNNKMEREVKAVNGSYIVPGKGKCVITAADGGFSVTTSQGEEYFYRPLQNCDRPLKEYPKKCKSERLLAKN